MPVRSVHTVHANPYPLPFFSFFSFRKVDQGAEVYGLYGPTGPRVTRRAGTRQPGLAGKPDRTEVIQITGGKEGIREENPELFELGRGWAL